MPRPWWPFVWSAFDYCMEYLKCAHVGLDGDGGAAVGAVRAAPEGESAVWGLFRKGVGDDCGQDVTDDE